MKDLNKNIDSIKAIEFKLDILFPDIEDNTDNDYSTSNIMSTIESNLRKLRVRLYDLQKEIDK